jgi:ABC-type nitrate/sulfonate/bicarbonate transport system substrate-binding protein
MPDKIAVGYVSRTFFSVPLWAAEENGYFAAQDLEVSTTVFGSAPHVPMLLDGTLHFVIGSPELAIQNTAEGGPVRLVAGNASKLVHSLITRAPFKRIEDLRGGTIGIVTEKEGTFFHVKTMLAAHGLHYPGDYKIKETGGVPPRHKALLEGSIDAGLQSVPWNFVAEDAGMNNLGEIIDYVPDWQFVSINANRDWIATHREIAVRFMRAMLRGTDWMYTHRAEAARIAARELPTPLHHAERAWDYFTGTGALPRDMSINLKGLAVVVATLKESGHLARDATDDLAFYIDDACLREARGR